MHYAGATPTLLHFISVSYMHFLPLFFQKGNFPKVIELGCIGAWSVTWLI